MKSFAGLSPPGVWVARGVAPLSATAGAPSCSRSFPSPEAAVRAEKALGTEGGVLSCVSTGPWGKLYQTDQCTAIETARPTAEFSSCPCLKGEVRRSQKPLKIVAFSPSWSLMYQVIVTQECKDSFCFTSPRDFQT